MYSHIPKSATPQSVSAVQAKSVNDSSANSLTLQHKADLANSAVQREERPNNTGMPDNLKSGIESLSGFSMDNVRVHYNSSKPATVQALAYTQGTDIHVAPGQEKCLPHEAWHVAQQMAGRVSPTTNVNGMPVNDNAALEREADVMGEKAVTQKIGINENLKNIQREIDLSVVQCEGNEAEGLYDLVDCLKSVNSIDKLYEKIMQTDLSLKKNYYNKKVVLLLYHCLKSSSFFRVICENYMFYKKASYGRYDPVFFLEKFLSIVPEFSEENIFNFVNIFISLNSNKLPNNILYQKTKLDEFVIYCQEQKKNESDLSYNDVKNALTSNETVSSIHINQIFDQGVQCLLNAYDAKKNGADYSGILEQFLKEDMACYGDGFNYSIYAFVNEQLQCYKGNFCRQFSAMILGVARKIAYKLGDPWAENRIARLLNERVKIDLGEGEVSSHSFFFKRVSAYARSNPILMFLNRELNEQDACHLIRIRGVRAYGFDCQEVYNKMFNELKMDANVVLKAMERTKAFLNDGKNFSPSKLGMFRLYRNNKYEEMLFDYNVAALKNFDIRNDNGFVDAKIEWRKQAFANDEQEWRQNLSENQVDDFYTILKKLENAPITIRLHSSDLHYQERPKNEGDPWFYHAKPWFDSVKIGETYVPYHPSSGRDGQNHYSLWRTYKDHLYRGMPWKRGNDGITTGANSQSIECGCAIQQSFGALNFNYEKNCYGLFGGYDYGNISLVLKSSVKDNCAYTIGDKGLAYSNVLSVAHALARVDDDVHPNTPQSRNFLNIVGDYNSMWKDMKEAVLGRKGGIDEQLEVQIFQDVKFGPKGNVDKIVCVGVTQDQYEQLLDMSGAPVERDREEKLIEKDEYKKFVERY